MFRASRAGGVGFDNCLWFTLVGIHKAGEAS